MPQKTKSLKFDIGSKQWLWQYRSLRSKNLCGLCNYSKHTVSICTSLKGIDRLDTECHEALHALQAYASEEHVAEVATTLATILWALGYRRDAGEKA